MTKEDYDQAYNDYLERKERERRINESYESDEYLARMGCENAFIRLNEGTNYPVEDN